MIDPGNPFTEMQQAFYSNEAGKWSIDNRDPVVGSFDAHNAWKDYDLLFDGIDTSEMLALDYGCGPGRMMVKYWDRFKIIDGADITAVNLVQAARWMRHNDIEPDTLWPVNGVDLSDVPDNLYDLIYSTICLQHIPVYDIRYNLFTEFYRILKPGGWFTAQMGYGLTNSDTDTEYYINNYKAKGTNGACDVKVTHHSFIGHDLMKIGFDKFIPTIRPVGPCDRHENWIFFRCCKPLSQRA